MLSPCLAMEMYDLLQCVDRALDKFGSNSKQATYWALMTKEGVSSDTIVSSPEALSRILAEIFGEEGSKIVEKTIIEEIKQVFSLEDPSSHYSLDSALEVARREMTGISETISI
jgi:hypothetical protein